MKRILGLDLGTTSIGWALVDEAENDHEKSSIIKLGVRVIPLTTDEETNFEKGQSITINAERTLKRGARRSLQRFKLRREQLISILKENKIISDNTVLAENGKNTTHSLWRIRALAAKEQIPLDDFARVLLAINKKRGYKSNRRTNDETEGEVIDNLSLAKTLQKKNITPGQYVQNRVKLDTQYGEKVKFKIPDFYKSDLQSELEKIWSNQRKYYPELLTEALKDDLKGKNSGHTWKICQDHFGIVGVKRKGSKIEQINENYNWRVEGLSDKLELEALAIVIQEINAQISNSSSYLGEISDRSKELYFRDQTIGQYLYDQLKENPHIQLKNQVFYRQDYLDEFNKIWEVQSKGRKEILTNDLKDELRDAIIFYQRRLKSQKGLISICELERYELEVEKNGKRKKKQIGPRVIPKSSPLFQEFKIWQILNNLKFRNLQTNEIVTISEIDNDISIRNALFNELDQKGKMSSKEVLRTVLENPKEWEIANYKELEGNNTNQLLNEVYNEIIIKSGHEPDKNDSKNQTRKIFELLGIDINILDFNSDLPAEQIEKQASYQLWHLLYSYEEDASVSGHDKLYKILEEKYGFPTKLSKPLVNLSFKDDYGSLSAKAIKKLLPFLKSGHEYSEACALAGYNHSHSVTKQENATRDLLDKIEILPKNSLRNPVVEKILNQMIHVVNGVIKTYGRPDEIRVEMARELKKNAKERADMTRNIARSTREHADIKMKLEQLHPFNAGVRITRNDIIKYRLYEELKPIGHKTIYTNTYIPLERLFTKEFDIEHIIPKAMLFDDSYSNKTIAVRDFNRIKSNKTGLDSIIEKYGEGTSEYERYINNVKKLFENDPRNKAKYNKLLMRNDDVPDGFIERDLRNSQYISRKALNLLQRVARNVVPTSGGITGKLREDWQLINVLREINWEKFEKAGLTKFEETKDGKRVPVIKEWSKREDHRHHAMDALTVAFSKRSYVQYFNFLNARRNENHDEHEKILAIERKNTYLNDKNKRLVKPPIPIDVLRRETKKHLESILVSYKAKGKVVTNNINKTKRKDGYNEKVELTPRGQLHKETVYGSSFYYETNFERVGPKFDHETIKRVAKKNYRDALMRRLLQFNDDPKKAFSGKNSLKNNPVYLGENRSEQVPEKVKLVYKQRKYTIRKAVNPDNFKNAKAIEKIIDQKQKRIMLDRFESFNSDAKAAFSNLEEDPIWFNKEKGISLKRVKIHGVTNAEPLHTKKNHLGKELIDENGDPIPVDYVSTGNNHHVAIYRDSNGDLQEYVVSFYEAVARVNAGEPIVWQHHPDHPDWEFMFTMKQNDYFVIPNVKSDFFPSEIDLLKEENHASISPYLFRIQKIASKNYVFNNHLETQAVSNDTLKNKELKGITYYFVQSPAHLLNIVKVHINHLGKIVRIGE